MRFALARLLWRFDRKLRKESEGCDCQKGSYLCDKGPLVVTWLKGNHALSLDPRLLIVVAVRYAGYL